MKELIDPSLPPSCLGILHKGSGENVFVSEQPPVISSIMGNGRRRSISCPSCNGLADSNKLLAPVALATGIDGSLYVGDLNFVRRVYPSLNTTGILELRYGWREERRRWGRSQVGRGEEWDEVGGDWERKGKGERKRVGLVGGGVREEREGEGKKRRRSEGGGRGIMCRI